MVLLLNAAFGDVGQPDDTSRAAVPLHGQRDCVDAEGPRLLETHVLAVVGVTVAIDEPGSGPAHREIAKQGGAAEVDTVDLGAIIGIPSGHDVASLESLLVILLLEHAGCGFDVGESALFVDMGVDEVAYLVGGLLGLSCHSAAQDDDVIVDEIDLVGYSVDGVAAACGGAWVRRGIRESAQAMTPPSYLMATIVVPMVSFG